MPGAEHADEEDEGEAEGSENSENSENGGKEEKLKVVVRVRPLQKSEEAWGSTPKDGAASADLDESSAPSATSMCIQVR